VVQSPTTTSADAIRQQMRQVRRELGEDVDGLVDNAQVLTDWRHYVRSYPWVCLGAAAVAGYLLVPSRLRVVQPDAATIAKLVREQKPKSASAGVAATIGSMIGNALLQGGLALAKQQLGKHLESYLQSRPTHVRPGAEVGEP